MSNPLSPPTEDEQRRFLIGFLFGNSLEPRPADCVARAYRDFQRTARGITKGARGPGVKVSALRLVERLLAEAIGPKCFLDSDLLR